ncbi:NK-tumor recognition protein isoform X3 [Bufo gargarizans]|uniref:NK-tumor recognition protein isoform X3 n=1 Tax=Bufo gargarizans TaxID=30331 RepID=UPI001CF5E763|nr:NK-tumor recognition protein isoform X3 [Bufo gargarizans]
MAEKTRPQCFFDVEINREPIGRIVFQLFSDVCPKTCTNFLCLCTGDKGIGKVTGKKLWYKGSTFHRVVKNFMIQGGDFSEGNGKGGESVFGGYFKDENFILKHDRAFLLSMANRGKHTNGSQFFITTKPAPHLDGVHVVFGLVISGFEVIEQIESLKTDAASRPYADVRVIDCGILGAKSTKDEKPKAAASESEESDCSSKSSSPSSSSESSSSESEEELEKSKKRKRKRKTKAKHAKRKRKDGRREVKAEKAQSHHSAHLEKNSTAEDKDSGTKRDKPVVRPEEIPPIPENRFLLRKDAPMSIPEPEQKPPPATAETTEQAKGSITKSGRKIRGRGTIRYHTPPRSRSQSESSGDRESSETPPHWKEEMQRLKSYKPPTGEKWSKGDKLNERLPSRWEEGSLSQRSRSNSWSHDGYHSDSSKERASCSKTQKKDKKVKHKKKSKKVKNSKKHKKKEELSGSHREESSSRRKKYSQEQTQRSSSRSSRDSSKKSWSQLGKEEKSSRHSSNSRSRSRSYSRRSARSRTASRSISRSRTRSRSHTESRSRNRNASGSHSNPYSHSSKQTKASSASPLKKDLTASKSGASAQTGKSVVKSNSKSTDKSLTAFVANENVHVISLSDSPPPSRWKPGQKPWKPSYERIPELKARTSNVLPVQSKYGSRKVKSNSRRKRHSSSESERSDYSARSSRSYHHKSKDRSSSRSLSRSYTRSRSGSSSSSHAERAVSSSYDSSSSSASNDEEERKRKTKLKIKDKHHKAKGKTENSVSPKSMGSPSNSNSLSGSEGEEFTKRLLKTTKALLENHNSNSSKEEVDKSVEESNTDGQNSKNDNDGTQEVISNIDKVPESDSLKETVEKLLNDDSICNSQITNATEEVASSGKEEGEASSESDSEEVNRSKTPPSEASQQASEKRSKSPPSSLEPKSKSKKHKRRSSKKSVKKSRSKSKAKDKSQKNKEKKQKAQKKKQTFHWQPPMEFGEEEEEEEMTGGQSAVQVKENNLKDLLLDKPSSAESRTAADAPLLIDKISAEPKIASLISAVKTEEVEPLSKVTKSPLTPANVEPTSDSIKAFTSHRSLPQIKLGTNATAGTPAGTTTANSEKMSSPSVSATPGESVQVKEEKPQDAQPASNDATSVEKVEAATSETAVVDNKWKPVQGPTVLQTVKPAVAPVLSATEPEKKTQGLRIEIKSKNKVKPGSLFDEVRKTARLNQRPRNQESSSEERSSSHEDKSRSSGKARSKSQTPSSHRSRTRSSSRSRSRSLRHSSSSRSRSYTRSRSRRRYKDYRSRTRSRSYGSYRSYSRTNSRSRSRSVSYERHRRRSRSRSHTYDSSNSRSRSRSPSYYRSRSHNRRSRRSSYSGSDRSYSYRRRHSGRS